MRTQREINKAIDSFEKEVKVQLSLGLTPNEAVRNAYAKYPVMDMMKATLQAELVNTFMAGYGDDVPYSAKSISQAMSESWASDDLTLSKRLYRRSSTIRNEVADTIKQALKTNKTVKGLAKSIFDGYGKGGIIPEASIPKFLSKLSDINISGEATPEAKRKERELLRSVKGKIARLDTPYVRAAYNEVAAAVEDGNEVRLQKAIYSATQEKARYHAERIARTENARAYADGQMNRFLDDDDIVAFQWKLSSRHPRYDICDFYANADLYGLGKGVYPKDKFPRLPAHPHCMCHIKPLTELDIDVNKRHNNLEQAGLEYIKSLSKKHQEVLLGVNGREQVLTGKETWQNIARGWTSNTFNARAPVMSQEMPKNTVKLHPPKGDSINSDYIIDTNVINNKAYRDKFNELGYSKNITKLIYSECIACLNVANGYNRERGIMIDLATKKVGKENIGKIGSNNVGIYYPNNDKTPTNRYVVIHNHPKNITFSTTDIESYLRNKSVHSAVLVDSMGHVYQIKNINRNIDVDKVVNDMKTLYNDIKQYQSTWKAMNSVVQWLVKEGVIEYEKK
nr:MAG TPA: minor capsid protein [Caudoviricetes sp.]